MKSTTSSLAKLGMKGETDEATNPQQSRHPQVGQVLPLDEQADQQLMVPRSERSYSKFTRDLQYWRGEQLRRYYENLANPQFRRPRKPLNGADLLDRLKSLGLTNKS